MENYQALEEIAMQIEEISPAYQVYRDHLDSATDAVIFLVELTWHFCICYVECIGFG